MALNSTKIQKHGLEEMKALASKVYSSFIKNLVLI